MFTSQPILNTGASTCKVLEYEGHHICVADLSPIHSKSLHTPTVHNTDQTSGCGPERPAMLNLRAVLETTLDVPVARTTMYILA